MGTNKILKIAGLNMGIAVIDTILFSPGLLGIEIGGSSTFGTAFGATAVFMSIVVFIYGNYKLLTEKKKIIQSSQINTTEDCIEALKQNYDKETFEKDIGTIIEQIKRFEKKKETIQDILLQKFDIAEISYAKFNGAILDIEDIFYINNKSIINKINAFDEEDYNRILHNEAKNKFSEEFIQAKLSIYEEYISFVKSSVEDNEEIILKLDQLLLEISKFNSLEEGEIENMDAIKEIDELIKKSKLYK